MHELLNKISLIFVTIHKWAKNKKIVVYLLNLYSFHCCISFQPILKIGNQGLVSKPPTSNPIPAPISPYVTTHQTSAGSSNASASSTEKGSLDIPCCRKTIAIGILKSQWLKQKSGILFHRFIAFLS